MVSSDAITRIAAIASPTDNVLWKRERMEYIGSMLMTCGIVGEETVHAGREEFNFNRSLRIMGARDVDESRSRDDTPNTAVANDISLYQLMSLAFERCC